MKPEDRKRLKQHIEMIVEHKIPSNVVFCPNCEKDVECIHTAELYECKECGEDFAKYIVSRKPAESDVSVTQDVLMDIKRDLSDAEIEELGAQRAESENICPDCDGSGEVAGSYHNEDGMTTCDRCNGRGVL